MSSIPVANISYIDFVQPFFLTDFYASLDNIREPYKFLNSIDSYAEYYEKYGKNVKKQQSRPAYLNKSKVFHQQKELRPLRVRHAFDSFWQDFRVKAKKQNTAFYLLPLKINISDETDFFANKKSIDYSGYAYLFPFGSLCVNLRVKNTEESTFGELIELMYSFRRSKPGFSNWARMIANEVNEQIFIKPQAIFDFQPHTMIFLEETNISPVMGDREHRKAIAGLIECKIDFDNLDKNYVDKLLECRLPNLVSKEIIIFYPSTTVIYPSPDLTVNKKDCMRTNYFDFLNFIFSIKHLIRACSAKKIPGSNLRLQDVKNAIALGFSNQDYSLEYFKNLYPKIAEKIELDKDLKTFMESK